MHDCDFDLSTEIVFLTGGGGILGARFARALATHGARIAIVDRSLEKAEKTALKINAEIGQRAWAYGADITDSKSVLRVYEKVKSDIGEVTALVNNAAAKSRNFFMPFEKFPLEDWNEVFRVNVTGAMICARLLGRKMAEQRRGSITNIISVYGIVAPDQRIYEGSWYEGQAINTPAVYSTSKAALLGLTKYLATYWVDKNVRSNAITPGGIYSGQNETFVSRYSARVPMGRMAERDEICGALIFLLSKASSYVTGQNIVVDGGLTVW